MNVFTKLLDKHEEQDISNEEIVVLYLSAKTKVTRKKWLSKLVKFNGRYVVSRVLEIARVNYRMQKIMADISEVCYQEGVIGMIKSVKTYNHKLGYKFLTHATPYIDREIRRRLSSELDVVYFPAWVSEREGARPKDSTRKHTVSTELALGFRDRLNHSGRYISLADFGKAGISTEPGFIQEDHLPVYNENYGELLCLSREVSEAMESNCDEREKVILKRFYANQESLQEVGNGFNLCRERINQLRRRALSIIKAETQLTEREVMVGIACGLSSVEF
jgi:RNA polymerase sigma factor (sigma-70 family)